MGLSPYKLYFDYPTSAFVPHVMLNELGVRYELVRVDTSIKAHREAEFRELNPNMLLPTLGLNDGRSFGENGAIVLMLGDLHPESGMVPRIKDDDRPFFLHWLFALATTGHTTMRRYSYPDEYTTKRDAEQATREAAWSQLVRFFDVLEDAISGDPWFMARGFSPLDIYTVMVCIVLTEELLRDAFDGRPKLERLYRSAHARDTVSDLWDFYRYPRP